MSTIENAIGLALSAHKGQKDKAGAPYILHPLRVMLSVDSDTDRKVAVLHDVIEDGGITPEIMRMEGFSEEVCSAVVILTKRKNEPYNEYLSRLQSNPVARRVKMADLKDNMNLNRIKESTQKDRERMEKYRKAMDFLKGDPRYKVYVDENSHYEDESERYHKGTYNDCETALKVCKEIVDDFLAKAYSKDKTEDQLWREYTIWGEDPFIIAPEEEHDCGFSAWDYAKEQIKKMVRNVDPK